MLGLLLLAAFILIMVFVYIIKSDDEYMEPKKNKEAKLPFKKSRIAYPVVDKYVPK